MQQIDFAAIKEAVSVEKAARFLGLELKQHGDTFRCSCPTCASEDPRAIVITPALNKWYCFRLKKGGDAIYIVSHVKGIGQRDAALLLQEAFMREAAPTSASSRKAAPKRARKKPVGGTGKEQVYTIAHYIGLE